MASKLPKKLHDVVTDLNKENFHIKYTIYDKTVVFHVWQDGEHLTYSVMFNIEKSEINSSTRWQLTEKILRAIKTQVLLYCFEKRR